MVTQQQETIADLLEQKQLSLEWLVNATGLERRIANAIARQRYTPSPERRECIARALGIPSAKLEGAAREATTNAM